MTRTIHLQGIGKVPAMTAGELEVGDILSWNYGHRCSEVIDIVEISEKSIIMTERMFKDGKEYPRRMMKKRLVAASKPD